MLVIIESLLRNWIPIVSLYYWKLLEYHIKKQIYLVGLFVKRATFWWTRLIYQSRTGIWIFTNLKLCLADAIHNFKWLKIIQIWQNGGQLFSNLADRCHI